MVLQYLVHPEEQSSTKQWYITGEYLNTIDLEIWANLHIPQFSLLVILAIDSMDVFLSLVKWNFSQVLI